MKKFFFVLLLFMFFLDVLYAQGDLKEGRTKATQCFACHTENGISLASIYPNLANQGERYLITQITNIQSGSRSVPEMAPFVGNLSSKDIEDIAAYFAKQQPAKGTVDPNKLELGRNLYRYGNAEKKIPACAACHEATGKGLALAGFPRISGQKEEYLIKQLKEFQSGKRAGNKYSKIMETITKRMNDLEIEAVASYATGLQ